MNCIGGKLLLVASLACGLTGCGGDIEMAPVTGRVLYNGQPLQFGSVMFQPPQGQPARGVIQADGSFKLDTTGVGGGSVVGRNQVRVTCYQAQNPRVEPGQFGEGLGESLIPTRYTQYETSGLTVDVQPDRNEPITLELSGP